MQEVASEKKIAVEIWQCQYIIINIYIYICISIFICIYISIYVCPNPNSESAHSKHYFVSCSGTVYLKRTPFFDEGIVHAVVQIALAWSDSTHVSFVHYFIGFYGVLFLFIFIDTYIIYFHIFPKD